MLNFSSEAQTIAFRAFDLKASENLALISASLTPSVSYLLTISVENFCYRHFDWPNAVLKNPNFWYEWIRSNGMNIEYEGMTETIARTTKAAAIATLAFRMCMFGELSCSANSLKYLRSFLLMLCGCYKMVH